MPSAIRASVSEPCPRATTRVGVAGALPSSSAWSSSPHAPRPSSATPPAAQPRNLRRVAVTQARSRASQDPDGRGCWRASEESSGHDDSQCSSGDAVRSQTTIRANATYKERLTIHRRTPQGYRPCSAGIDLRHGAGFAGISTGSAAAAVDALAAQPRRPRDGPPRRRRCREQRARVTGPRSAADEDGPLRGDYQAVTSVKSLRAALGVASRSCDYLIETPASAQSALLLDGVE